ncbi:hypothetical protein CROQUDRAFT_96676 [Cronartium quercuum f. sp. fusiforme G11]|uniref:Uncharacterized protein n=1 Tax=Cronartium quercuum f. sp. fusiforme G11 TaxID=708437 RepID=A0A9P6T8J9_9BASI|nr:hypothetical protein CROQUDRAFT_96676 [Cronartium quercuum f. sp. fusiforme G11]
MTYEVKRANVCWPRRYGRQFLRALEHLNEQAEALRHLSLSLQLTPEQAIDRMRVYFIQRQAAERVFTLLSPENVRTTNFSPNLD